MKSQIFYGAGFFAERNLGFWLKNGFSPACFADKSKDKQGKLFPDIFTFEKHDAARQYAILSLSEAIERYPNYEIVVAVGPRTREDIKAFLLKLDIPEERITLPPFDLPNHFHNVFDVLRDVSSSNLTEIVISKDKVVFKTTLLGKSFAIVNNSECNSTALMSKTGAIREEDELRTFMALFNDNETLLDIGANVGIYSVTAGMFRNNVSVFAVEPVRETYDCLVATLAENKCQATTANVAMYDKTGTAEFFRNRTVPSSSSLDRINTQSIDNRVDVIRVDTVRADDFILKYDIKRLDYIKCDVEGAEKFVIDGARNVIAKFRPIIQLELIEALTVNLGYHPDEVASYLRQCGYACYHMNNGKLIKIDGGIQTLYGLNFWFLPTERADELIKKVNDSYSVVSGK